MPYNAIDSVGNYIDLKSYYSGEKNSELIILTQFMHSDKKIFSQHMDIVKASPEVNLNRLVICKIWGVSMKSIIPENGKSINRTHITRRYAGSFWYWEVEQDDEGQNEKYSHPFVGDESAAGRLDPHH